LFHCQERHDVKKTNLACLGLSEQVSVCREVI